MHMMSLIVLVIMVMIGTAPYCIHVSKFMKIVIIKIITPIN